MLVVIFLVDPSRLTVGDLQYVNVTISGYWSVLHHCDALVYTVIIIISG